MRLFKVVLASFSVSGIPLVKTVNASTSANGGESKKFMAATLTDPGLLEANKDKVCERLQKTSCLKNPEKYKSLLFRT